MADAQKHPVEIRLWMRIVFFLSLAVNLLVVGALVGVLVTKPKTRHRSMHASRNLVQPYLKALDSEDRQAFQTEMAQSYKRSSGGQRIGAQTRKAAFELLTADPFVRADFSNHLTRQLDYIKTIQGAGVKILLNRIVAMNMAERLAYTARLETHMRRNGRAKSEMSGRAIPSAPRNTVD
jgi:uncharacterized membrane protein